MIINKNILAKIFKVKIRDIDYKTNQLCKTFNIKFKTLNYKKREKAITDTLSKIQIENRIAENNSKRKKIWETGWNNLNKSYLNNKNSLIPEFYTKRKNTYFRLEGKFIKSSKSFEYKMINIFRNWYFNKYFKNIQNIYEFGAGSGHNLVAFSKLFPDKNFFASDFSLNSVRLMKKISKKNKFKWKCFQFDMLKKNKKFFLKKDSGVYTSGSIEQLSGNIDNFLSLIIKNRPKICLHVEPIPQLFNNKNIEDVTSLIAISKKNYTSNLLDKLISYEKKGKIKILKKMKSPFGSQLIDGMNLLVWKSTK